VSLVRGILYGLILGAVAGYWKGCTDGERELDAFQAKISDLAHQQDLRTAARVAKAEQITEFLAQEHEHELQKLRARNADLARRLRDASARPLIVPTVSNAPGRPDGEVCYDVNALERGIRGHLDRAAGRLAGLLQRGDEAVMLQALCSKWLNEQLRIVQ
jgi:TolA-binding protein